MEAFGLTAEQLRDLPKSDGRKVHIARSVGAQTTVPLRWLAEQLRMGSAMKTSRLTTIKRDAKIFS